jgi:hypothetical protein
MATVANHEQPSEIRSELILLFFSQRLVVYPAVDLLEDHTGKIYPSDNAVATFDWSLKLNWEVITLNSPSRMPLLPSPPISRVEPLLSPALPPTYATSVDFLLELGGLATTSLLSPWGADNIELALRYVNQSLDCFALLHLYYC